MPTRVGLVVGTVKTQHSDTVPADGIAALPDAGTLVDVASSVDLEQPSLKTQA